MPKDYSYGELIHVASKKGRANGAILTRVEVDEPWLKMFWVKEKDLPTQEVEYDEKGNKKTYTRVANHQAYKEYEKFGGKLCLCEYMKHYRDKIPYYNRDYILRYGVPLYDNSGELVKIRRKGLK